MPPAWACDEPANVCRQCRHHTASLLLTLRSCQAELAHHISAQYRLRAAAPIQTIDIEGIHHGIWDSSYSNLLGRGGEV